MPVVANKGAARKASRKGPDTGTVTKSNPAVKKTSNPVPRGLYGSKPTGKPLPKHK